MLIVSVADMVELVVVGLTFVASIGAAIDTVIAKFDGHTVVIDGESLVVGDTFGAEDLLARCATHGAVARQIAPDMLLLLQDSKPRAIIAKRVAKLQTQVQAAIDKLRAHDSKLVHPYDLDSLFNWNVAVDKVAVNEHTTIEHRSSRRTTARPSAQGKTVGKGKGHRMSLWTTGVYPLTAGMFKGFTLTLSEENFTVTRDGEFYFSEPITDFAKVAKPARKCYDLMYAAVNDGASNGNPNVPRTWKMPLATVDSETQE